MTAKIINLLDHLQKQTKEYRKSALRKALIDYYQSLNGSGISIPAFQLADLDIKRIEAENSINYWYKRLINAR